MTQEELIAEQEAIAERQKALSEALADYAVEHARFRVGQVFQVKSKVGYGAEAKTRINKRQITSVGARIYEDWKTGAYNSVSIVYQHVKLLKNGDLATTGRSSAEESNILYRLESGAWALDGEVKEEIKVTAELI